MNIAYKILNQAELEMLSTHGQFEGSALDRADGFIHLSTPEQAAATAAKYFAGRTDLVCVVVDLTVFDSGQLRWEPSRGGALFPHLYVPLPGRAVIRHVPLRLGADGLHVFPVASPE